MNIAHRVGKKRNLLAHDIRGHCDELPDALLRIEVGAAVQVMLNLEKVRRERIEMPRPGHVHPLLKIDATRVWVYRTQDFNEILGEMNKLRLYITSMHHFAGGGPSRAAISRLLDNERLLQEELSRVRANRQSSVDFKK
jgi:hypothetical protein